MFKQGDYVVYKRSVCKIEGINLKKYNNVDYYILKPVNDQTLKIDIPTSNTEIRELISLQEIKKIISEIPSITIIDANDKIVENEYKRLLKNDCHEDLIKIIKTAYLRNKNRFDNNKKISEKDDDYFKKAEKYLYTEFSIVLNMTYDDTKKYVTKEVEKITN